MSGAHVLLVDDDAIQRRAVGRILSTEGFEITFATNGREALDELGGRHVDVVLSDVMMPEMSGIDLLRSIRRLDLEVPVILMTATPDLVTAHEAKRYGALNYLTKPIDAERMVLTVRRALWLGRLAHAKREALELLGTTSGLAGDLAGLELSFERALKEIWIAYQPILRVADGTLFGYEALMRSDVPALPHVGAVIDAAERLDRTDELGQRVRALAPQPLVDAEATSLLFVNLHPRDLLDDELFSDESPLGRIAKRVVLEITERASLDKIEGLERRVNLLRGAGFRLAVDDLGAGYAGLSSLVSLEPEFVKIDMSLVRDADHSPKKQRLIRSITEACHDMGAAVIAEGIETVGERDAIVAAGCDQVQGYLFARPGRPFPAYAWP